MHSHTYTRTRTHTCTYAHMHTHTCTHAHTYTHMYTCTHALSHMYTRTHAQTCTHAHTHTCTHTHMQTTKSSGSSKRRLQFKGKDVLNIVSRRKRTTSSSSNDGDSENKSPLRPSSRLNKLLHIPKLGRQSKDPTAALGTGIDSQVKTASGHYSVAPRDVSVLERISHKAQNRANRVRKPHEVWLHAYVACNNFCVWM